MMKVCCFGLCHKVCIINARGWGRILQISIDRDDGGNNQNPKKSLGLPRKVKPKTSYRCQISEP